MLNNQKLGNLTVDLNANIAPLRRGMAAAKGVIGSSVKGIGSAFNALRGPVLALLGLLGVAGLARTFSSMAEQAKKLAVLENSFKRLNRNAKYTFKDMEMGMLKLARVTGVSSRDQTDALQQLMNQLAGIETPENIQSILMPIALDWAAASGKDAKDAAKDVADAFLGELPEDFKVVKIKYEAETGKKFDDLTRAEKWKLVYDYLQTFKGAAEAAGNTLGGSFNKVKTAITEVLDAIMGSQNFDPLIGMFQKMANGLFDLAERIKKGDIPPLLLAIQTALTRMMEAVGRIDWGAVFKKIADAFDWLAKTDDKGVSNIEKLMDALGKLAVFLATGGLLSALLGLGKGFGTAAVGVASFFANLLGGLAGKGLESLAEKMKAASKAAATDFFENGGEFIGTKGAKKNAEFMTSMDNLLNGQKSAHAEITKTYQGFWKNLGDVINTGWKAVVFQISGGWKAITTGMSGGMSLFVQSVKMDGLIGAFKNLPMIIGLGGEQIGASAAAIGASGGVIAIALAAIIAAIVAFIAAWKGNWDGIRDRTAEAWEGIKKTFVDVWNTSIKPIIDQMAKGWNDLREELKKIGIDIGAFKDIFKTIWTAIKDTIGSTFTFIIETIGFAVKTIGNLIGIIIEAFKFLWTAIVGTCDAIAGTLVDLVTGDFGNIGKRWSEWFNNLGEPIAKIGKYIMNFFGDLLQWLAQFFDKLLAPFTHIIEGLGEFREKVRKWGESVAQTFKDWGQALVDWFKSFFGIHSPSKLMSDIGDWIGQGLFNGIKAIFEKFGELVDMVKNFFGNIKDNVTGWISDMAGKFSEHAKNVGSWIGDQAKAFGGWVKDTASNLADGAGKFVGFAADMGKNYVNYLKDAGSFIADHGKKLVGWVSDTASNLLSGKTKFGDFASDMGKKYVSYLQDAGGFIADHGKKMVGWVADTGTNFLNLAGKFVTGQDDIGSKFRNWIEKDVASMGSNFVGKISGLIAPITEKWTSIKDKFVEGTGNVWQKFNDGTWSIGEMAKDYVGKFTSLPGKIKDGLSSLTSVVSDKMGGAVDTVSDKIGDMLSAITDMGTRFWNAGAGLFTAMLNGLKNAWSSVSGWISDKLQWIRDRLPGSDAKTGPLSTLTKAGRGLFTAMQGGMEKQFPTILRSVEGFAGDIKDALPTADAFAGVGAFNTPVPASYGGYAAQGPTIVIQGNYFMNDRAIDEFVDTLDKKFGQKMNK